MRLIGVLKGDTAGQQLGRTCEGLGDINGDGYADFLVGVRGTELRLYLGGLHPFDSPPALTWPNNPLFSSGLINLGDVDCDGVNDFVGGFGPYSGDTLKLSTGLERLDPAELLILFDAPKNEGGDYQVAGGGDNNNDGRQEFWVRWPESSDSVIYGFSGCDLLDTVPDYFINCPYLPGRYQVSIICSSCDLNGDSIPDIVYGQPVGIADSIGRVSIIWGGSNLSNRPDMYLHAPYPHAANDEFGWDLDCLGDISGDGIDDLWVSQGGRNYIYFGGRPFDSIPDIALDWSYMYWDMACVGDVNNDGWNDVILVMADYLINRVSCIYCYPGMDTLVDVVYSDDDFYHAQWVGNVCCAGVDYSRVGDVDGDGIDDILISARTTDYDPNDYGLIYVQAGWDSIPTDVSDDPPPAIPDHMELKQNYPNPFNPGTTIEFILPLAGYAEVKIYDLLGEVVAVPMRQHLPAGNHRITWDGLTPDGEPAASGIYFYRLTAGPYSDTRKMMLMK